MKAYQQENAEAVRAMKRTYREANRDQVNAYFRQYRAERPGSGAQYCAARRARLAGAVGSHSNADWLRMCRIWNMCCAYCGKSDVSLTRDHSVPLSRGGSDFIGNIVPACLSCNSGKCDRTIIEWRAGRWPRTEGAISAQAIPHQSAVPAA